MAANSEITAAKQQRGRPFQQGISGNPNGRPKQTKEEKDALMRIRGLTSLAVDEMERILTDKKASASLKLEVIKIVLDRAYGKPTQPMEITADPIRIIDDVPRGDEPGG